MTEAAGGSNRPRLSHDLARMIIGQRNEASKELKALNQRIDDLSIRMKGSTSGGGGAKKIKPSKAQAFFSKEVEAVSKAKQELAHKLRELPERTSENVVSNENLKSYEQIAAIEKKEEVVSKRATELGLSSSPKAKDAFKAWFKQNLGKHKRSRDEEVDHFKVSCETRILTDAINLTRAVKSGNAKSFEALNGLFNKVYGSSILKVATPDFKRQFKAQVETALNKYYGMDHYKSKLAELEALLKQDMPEKPSSGGGGTKETAPVRLDIDSYSAFDLKKEIDEFMDSDHPVIKEAVKQFEGIINSLPNIKDQASEKLQGLNSQELYEALMIPGKASTLKLNLQTNHLLKVLRTGTIEKVYQSLEKAGLGEATDITSKIINSEDVKDHINDLKRIVNEWLNGPYELEKVENLEIDYPNAIAVLSSIKDDLDYLKGTLHTENVKHNLSDKELLKALLFPQVAEEMGVSEEVKAELQETRDEEGSFSGAFYNALSSS